MTETRTEGWRHWKPRPDRRAAYHYIVAGTSLCGAVRGHTDQLEPDGERNRDDCRVCRMRLDVRMAAGETGDAE